MTEPPLQIVTTSDGSWKCTLTAPQSEEWSKTAFDDRDWLDLAEADMPQLERSTTGYYQCRACSELGAICLGLPRKANSEKSKSWMRWLPGGRQTPGRIDQVWIRKEFEIPPPEFHES